MNSSYSISLPVFLTGRVLRIPASNVPSLVSVWQLSILSFRVAVCGWIPEISRNWTSTWRIDRRSQSIDRTLLSFWAAQGGPISREMRLTVAGGGKTQRSSADFRFEKGSINQSQWSVIHITVKLWDISQIHLQTTTHNWKMLHLILLQVQVVCCSHRSVYKISNCK